MRFFPLCVICNFSTFIFLLCEFKNDIKLFLIRKEVASSQNCDRVELTEDVLVISALLEIGFVLSSLTDLLLEYLKIEISLSHFICILGYDLYYFRVS